MFSSRFLIATLTLLAAAGGAAARATPYWVEYTPASGMYPEEVGWTRSTWGGEALRWFDNGSLVMDSRASTHIADSYSMLRPGQIDPGPGELFIMSWRMRTDELQGLWDSGVGVFSDERRAVFLDFGYDAVWDGVAGHVAVTFDAGAFHDFKLQSSNMLTYDLYIDAVLAYSGNFTPPLVTASKIAWGDETQGGASLTHWDFFRFGVVPEPNSALVGVTLLTVAHV